MSSSVPTQKRNLIALLRELFPDARVTYGPPVTLDADMVWLGDTRVVTEQPTSSGARGRSRRERVEQDVVMSKYVQGSPDFGDDAQQKCIEGAYVMYDALDEHFRTVSSPDLFPGASPAILSEHEASQPRPAYGERDIIQGWVGNITATISNFATV